MRKAFGVILLGVGVLLAGGGALVTSLLLLINDRHGGLNLDRVAVVGGIPFAIGAALLAASWLLLNKGGRA